MRGWQMSASALQIRATVRMQPASNLPIVKPLTAGWGPVIFYSDKCYPGRILKCETPIEPGQVGEAIIGMMTNESEAIDLQVGSIFELRSGPQDVIATATVIELV